MTEIMRQQLDEVLVHTSGRGFFEITSQVGSWITRTGISVGVLTLLVRHTSASLLIQENADPDVRVDLESFFSDLVPDGDSRFMHSLEGPDDMPAHIRSALTQTTLSIPVSGGALLLGTWQGIYLWEHRAAPHVRRIALHLLGS